MISRLVSLVVVAVVVGWIATNVMAQGKYYCAMDKVSETMRGEFDCCRNYDKARRPSLVEYPPTDDKSLLWGEVDPSGRYFDFVRVGGSDEKVYMAHGRFDFQDNVLVTSQTMFTETDDGQRVPLATTFKFVCTSVEVKD